MIRNILPFNKGVCDVLFRQTIQCCYNSSRENAPKDSYSKVEQETGSSSPKLFNYKVKAKTLDKYLLPDCQVVHNDANIQALNKPQFLSVFGASDDKDNVTSAQKTIVDILPDLAADIRCPNLEVFLSLKSFYSGLVLLSKTSKAKTSLKKHIMKVRRRKSLYLSYLAITVGEPQCRLGALSHIYVGYEYIHGQEMCAIKDKTGKRPRGKLIDVPFAVDLIDSNPDVGAALVRISVNKEKYGVIEAVLSEQLSPVLGDKIYSPRIISVMGVPFSTSHSPHMTPPGLQRLPQKLTDCLDSDPDVPRDYHSRLFLHRHQVYLHQFPDYQDDPLTLTAPLPSYFLATLKCLGLADNIQDL